MGSGPSSSSSSTSILDRMRPSLLLTLLLILLLNASDAFLLGRSGLPSSRVAGPAPTVAAAAGVAVRGHGRRCKGACAMQRQTREVEVYDPSSYISIMKNQPVEWFDNTMSYGVFNWGLSSTGDMQKELKKIPIFPLNIVGTPGATRQLRVFEPRYRQLFQDIFNDKMGHNRTFGLVFTEGKGPAKVGCLMQVGREGGREGGRVFTEGKGLPKVGCLMQVEMLQYENQRADRFMTWNLAVERFAIRSLNTQDQPYVVATAETGYEDLPLVQRLVPECDALEGKIEALVREILAYCIRWECKALEQERMTQLEPVANRCLKYRSGGEGGKE
ncbi:hypothetical protein VYU27_009884, partial [Nannochloropsis oceanica]